jgi:hypothetical protein
MNCLSFFTGSAIFAGMQERGWREDIAQDADISDCGQYRYCLSRIWAPDQQFLLFIGLNPSTADKQEDDPTIRRLINFTHDWGYGGFFIGNLFAFRSPQPTDLLKAEDPVGPRNDWHLEQMARRAEKTVFVWGHKGCLQERDTVVKALFPIAYCIARSKPPREYPRHPLYLSKDCRLQPFFEPRGRKNNSDGQIDT